MQPVAQAYLQQHRLSVARALLGCLETQLDRTPGLSLHSWRHQCHELFPAAHHLSRPDVLNKLLVHVSSHWRRGKKLLTNKTCRVVELWRPEKKLNLGRTQLRNSTMVLFQKFFPHWELWNCGIEELRRRSWRLKLLALLCFSAPTRFSLRFSVPQPDFHSGFQCPNPIFTPDPFFFSFGLNY